MKSTLRSSWQPHIALAATMHAVGHSHCAWLVTQPRCHSVTTHAVSHAVPLAVTSQQPSALTWRLPAVLAALGAARACGMGAVRVAVVRMGLKERSKSSPPRASDVGLISAESKGRESIRDQQ